MTNVVVRHLVATSPSATWHLDSAWSFSSVSGRLGLWAAISVRRWSGSLYLVVGVGRRVVAVIRSVVVWLLWWLMEERRNVTRCDMSVMFELTREIT